MDNGIEKKEGSEERRETQERKTVGKNRKERHKQIDRNTQS